MEKPTLPKGTRDFGPSVMAKRQFILNSIKSVFSKFGFLPLETPAMENLSTLTGKYGEEGDQLLFKILNSGDFLSDLKNEIPLSGTQFRELFDLVNHEVGQKKNRRVDELEEIIPSVLGQIKFRNSTQEKLLVSFINSNLGEVAEYISQWLREPASGKTPVDKYIDFFEKRNWQVSQLQSGLVKDYISEKGLRYDLTVPFARYVVMNRHEITLPFKRYQVQPVWRADRPQKGRYREFYQCDADVVGTNSLLCEAEIILMIREVFSHLDIMDYTIKINHRGILAGLAELLTVKGKETELYTAIDKLDKIGESGVRQELMSKGFDEAACTKLFQIVNVSGTNKEKLDFLKMTFEQSAKGLKGTNELQEILTVLNDFGTTDDHVVIDIALARGLTYYTGTIFEVKINNVAIGSVSGGGRYDNLTQAFGSKEPLPGVGISFGVDRIYDAMEELNLFPKDSAVATRVLICHLDEACMRYGLKILIPIRKAGIASEIYPDVSKLKKQLDFANKKRIPFAIVIGSDEMKSGTLTIKQLQTGEQENLPLDEIIRKLRA